MKESKKERSNKRRRRKEEMKKKKRKKKNKKPPYPVQVSVGIFGHVVVEDDVDSLDVHPAPEQVGRHQDALLEIFELLIARQPSERGNKGLQRTAMTLSTMMSQRRV